MPSFSGSRSTNDSFDTPELLQEKIPVHRTLLRTDECASRDLLGVAYELLQIQRLGMSVGQRR
jgi:hypothetical protein